MNTKKYSPISNQLFIENRKRFAAKLKSKSVAVFHSNDEQPRNGDANHPFRQDSDILYLSGIDQEQTVLVLCPEASNSAHREILFLRKTSKEIAVWEGHKYTMEEAREASGIQTIYWIEDLEKHLHNLVTHNHHIYVNLNENDRYVSDVVNRNMRGINALKNKYPVHEFERLGPIMMGLREVKSEIEIALMQEACDITEKALRRILKFTKPGVWEYEMEAEIIHEFLINRSTGHAYSPIIATGNNANCLHYTDNNSQVKDGDLILMDFGAEYGNYAADLSRTIPANGRFTDRQKAVYSSVLHVMKESTKMLVPGTILNDYHVAVGRLMEAELVKLGLLDTTDIKNQDPNWPAYKKYFMHGTSHYIGLDVHDLGSRVDPFVAGNVFTCEPGIYIPEEGIGIRIENDIVVTNDGPFDLMRNIPREIAEIEDIMNG
ncbi:MAG: Xaa-Pro aminopeptidase [Flavobacteriales bacterium]|jgi:Xaa-Pro aminopeptidase